MPISRGIVALMGMNPERLLVNQFDLSIRAYHVLGRLKINTLGDLAALGEDDLLLHYQCGRKTVSELRDLLAESGLSFSGPPVSAKAALASVLDLKELPADGSVEDTLAVIRKRLADRMQSLMDQILLEERKASRGK